jgi:hypothetical protein
MHVIEDITQPNQLIIGHCNVNCISFEIGNFIYYTKAFQASRQFILNAIYFHSCFSISEDIFFFQLCRHCFRVFLYLPMLCVSQAAQFRWELDAVGVEPKMLTLGVFLSRGT